MRTPPHSQGTEQIYMELLNITYAHFAAHTIVLSAYVNVNNSLVKVTLIDIALLLLLFDYRALSKKRKITHCLGRIQKVSRASPPITS